MHYNEADLIALMAAPIYAALLMGRMATVGVQTPEKLAELRLAAIMQAVELRGDVEGPDPR